MDVAGSCGVFVGGASGMCRATVEQFVAKGGSAAILDLASSDGAAVAQSLGAQFYPCDVMDYEGIEAVIGAAVEGLGAIHLLLNTAGGGGVHSTLAKDGSTMHPLDDFRHTIDFNLIASFNINRITAKHMANNKPNEAGERGLMINTGSILAFEAPVGQVAYTAAKGAIHAMTLTMARELGDFGIRVMALAPGSFATGLTAGVPDDFIKELLSDAAFPRRLGEPDEFATMAIAVFESAMMNGETIRIDGGKRFTPR